ncbi:hypothetical protein RHECNPAF_9300136 [Rhizobium etli CNPAF512]|nr:hypothetical protein RHECNPAF_9300136 [Rhizobium etli CNPAF512]
MLVTPQSPNGKRTAKTHVMRVDRHSPLRVERTRDRGISFEFRGSAPRPKIHARSYWENC